MTVLRSALIQANSLRIPLAAGSVHCVITSPPYWGLRDYGQAGQLGLESRPDCLGWATGANCGECYICHQRQWAAEVWRVLRDNGTFWLNLGDCYNNTNGYERATKGWFREGRRGAKANTRNPNSIPGLKPKDLIGIPWRVALALQSDGWYLRRDIIWAKPNPMPESVTDRPTTAHEYIFLLAKQGDYYYDAEAIKEPQATGWNGSSFTDERDKLTKPGLGLKPRGGGFSRKYAEAQPEHGAMNLERPLDKGTRNKRSVWTVATQPYSGAHYATWPEKLVEPMVLAGCPKAGIVLDPFCGSGTTVQVARRLGRVGIGLDLSHRYLVENALPRALNTNGLACMRFGLFEGLA